MLLTHFSTLSIPFPSNLFCNGSVVFSFPLFVFMALQFIFHFILVFSSCFIEISFSLASSTQYWRVLFSLLGYTSLQIFLLMQSFNGSFFVSWSPTICQHGCLTIYFHLAFVSCGRLHVGLLFPLESPLQIVLVKLLRKARCSLSLLLSC